MNTRHLHLQPEDPVAARIGALVIKVGVVLTVLMVVASFIRI